MLSIERDENGLATAIVAAGGQRTELGYTDGYLASIANEAGETYGGSHECSPWDGSSPELGSERWCSK